MKVVGTERAGSASLFAASLFAAALFSGALFAMALLSAATFAAVMHACHIYLTRGDLAQLAEQISRQCHGAGMAQPGAGIELCVDGIHAFTAQREVVGRPHMRSHAQLAVDKRRDGLGCEMLG
ncbi:hypothetical protein A5777_01040 [Gordonia sp. 852002-10350_SCH5691597]|nr:hypothetical protein A5777_01040 [Gordonia sp. 852002-10350_SCH5691597]